MGWGVVEDEEEEEGAGDKLLRGFLNEETSSIGHAAKKIPITIHP